MEAEERKKMASFSYSVEDEGRLNLIDISSEDDFLIASPLFESLEDLRLSVTWDKNGENDCFRFSGVGNSFCNVLPQSGRPSFLRRSLAWDNAFSTSSGVLDPDELLFINKGACPKPESKQNVPPRRTVNGNMNKIKTVSKRDQHGDIQASSEDKTNKKKAPLPVQSKYAFGSSCSSSRFSSSTSTIFSSDSSFASKDSIPYLRRSSSTRTLSKTKPGSKKTTLPPSNRIPEVPDSSQAIGILMDGTPKRDVVTSQESAGIPISGNSKPSCLRLPSPKIGFFDELAPKARGFFKFQIGKASKSSKEDAGRTPSGSGKQKLKASSTPQQPRSAPPFRLTASSLFSADKSSEMDGETFCKSRKVGSGECERRSIGINHAPNMNMKGEQRKGRKEREERKNKRGGESLSIREKNAANDLSRGFKMMGLGEDEEETATRTPLAEKTATSHSNGNVTEPKKEKMVEKKSPVFLFPASHKENI
ncbi:hypothetical protein DM860_014197 [Cuscuta australis]|uniref:Uncharacterized protein n=1 Tax=Cuscuta australis TaxID=267555 RepID=A0A328DDW6_9ASTE|nr:hypothetical protein DM860_014197 [Cuscuta australis]